MKMQKKRRKRRATRSKAELSWNKVDSLLSTAVQSHMHQLSMDKNSFSLHRCFYGCAHFIPSQCVFFAFVNELIIYLKSVEIAIGSERNSQLWVERRRCLSVFLFSGTHKQLTINLDFEWKKKLQHIVETII